MQRLPFSWTAFDDDPYTKISDVYSYSHTLLGSLLMFQRFAVLLRPEHSRGWEASLDTVLPLRGVASSKSFWIGIFLLLLIRIVI